MRAARVHLVYDWVITGHNGHIYLALEKSKTKCDHPMFIQSRDDIQYNEPNPVE